MKTIIHKDAKRLAAGADESPFDVRTKKRNIHRRVMKVTGNGAVGGARQEREEEIGAFELIETEKEPHPGG
jgi:hypothetical protein